MKELFPELKGLNGGKKQHWINANLDNISMLADIMPFEDLCQILHSKSDTVVKALQKAEKKHRPAIRGAEKNSLKIQKVETDLDVFKRELQMQTEVLAGQVEKVGNLQEDLAEFFSIQASLNSFMKKRLLRADLRTSDYSSLHNIYSAN
ncbi:hypothetical protein ACFLVZ_00655 [Chloroflexota bacterium]